MPTVSHVDQSPRKPLTVPKSVRETVEAVASVVNGGEEEHATNRAVAEDLEIDKAAASRRVRAAISRGYLKNLEDRKGHPARLVIGEEMPEDREILPSPEDLGGVDPLTGSPKGHNIPLPLQGTNGNGGGGVYTSSETASTCQPLADREVSSI